MQTLSATPIRGQRVVVRMDTDVPVSAAGQIEGDLRLRAVLPTLEYLRDNGAARIVLIGHRGRPVSRHEQLAEQIAAGNPTLTMEPVAWHLRRLLDIPAESLSTKRLDGLSLPAYILARNLYLIENLRFDWRERAGDQAFAQALAGLGDVYVYDSFANAHRDHASTQAVRLAPAAAAGIQFEREVSMLSQLTEQIQHPSVAILGGAKLETKLPIIERLLNDVDTFCLGGVMANTFAAALGREVKQSVVDTNLLVKAKELYTIAPERFLLPEDWIWHGQRIVDIGPKSRAAFADAIRSAKTIFWNGTLGLTSPTAQDFRIGSLEIARAIAANRTAHTVVSGGDTVGLLDEEQLDLEQFTFVSTGGGSTLQFLSGQPLPALEALNGRPTA